MEGRREEGESKKGNKNELKSGVVVGDVQEEARSKQRKIIQAFNQAKGETSQNKTKQNKTKQNKTKQNKTKQNNR